MDKSMKKIDVFLEAGKKKTFAGAIEWPGWCRSGHDEESALESLCNYAPRYSTALGPSQLFFQPPADAVAFVVVERIEGDTSTDFGVPRKFLSSDARPVDEVELHRFQELLKSFWQSFDAATSTAAGKELRKGPRGGGRDLDDITRHIRDADAAYLEQVGWKFEPVDKSDPDLEIRRIRQTILDALTAAAYGEIPARGPRGGIRWTPRYFVRRVAWHVVDHAWEIEDRIR
jgi:hypothetical protein